MDNISIKKANTYEDEFLRDKQRWWAYEQKEKELRDYVDFIYDAECRTRVKAKAEGKAEGKEETLQAVARNMREKGLSLEDIGMYINKDADEVKALLKDV